MKLRERLSAFRKQRHIPRRQLAEGLDVSPHTLNGWMLGKTPPAILSSLLDVLETSPQARSKLGLSWGRYRPRGRPFEKKNPWRIGSPTREAALRDARAKRKREK